jgi:hypothetical protein
MLIKATFDISNEWFFLVIVVNDVDLQGEQILGFNRLNG